jgi:hypothetical protein
MAWFVSAVICIVLEGTYFTSGESRVINDLALFTSLKVGGLVPIPTFNLYFFRGVYRLITWDYSFYSGGYEFLRWMWMAILSPGAVWGIGSVFAPVFANFLRIFR